MIALKVYLPYKTLSDASKETPNTIFLHSFDGTFLSHQLG